MVDVLQIISKPTFRDLRGRFARADEALLTEKRERIRALGRRYVEIARQEAPERTGKFRKSLIYRTFQSGDEVGFTAYSQQPLGTFIVLGTKPHIIQARQKSALYFFWPKVGMDTIVPKGGGFKTHVAGGRLWIGKGYVNHPGTQPNPYHERAYATWLPEAEIELRRISLKYVEVIQGKTE